MAIFLQSLFGCTSIGVYSLVTDRMIIVPPQVSEPIAQRFEESLKTQAVRTTIGESVLVGSLACANSNGIVLPHFALKEEIQAIRSAVDINITVMETEKTAYGNLVLANDYGAAVDPRLKKRNIAKISDTLGVETVEAEIAGLPHVGSLATATNRGVLAHPLLRDEERNALSEVLSVQIDVGTINCGIPYISMGLIGNRNGAIAGSLTTGSELMIVGQALDVVREDE